MILDDKARELHLRIHAMWRNGLDTVDMSRVLLMSEASAERALHAMMEDYRHADKQTDAK